MRVIKRDDEGEGASGDRLDQLADQAGAFLEQPAGPPDLEAQRAAEQEAQAISAMEAGAQRMLFGVLKAVRTRIGRKLPEIHGEWRDPDLEGVAAAAVPVGKKHLARLMPMLGQYPEEAALALACLPLVMGYVAAVEKHDTKAAAPAVAAPGAAGDAVAS